MTLTHAHHIKLKYHGPTNTRGSRVSATWAGWPTDDNRPVRRFFEYDSIGDRDSIAMQAAEAFVAWLDDGEGRMTLAAACLADAGSDGWSLHVKTARNEA